MSWDDRPRSTNWGAFNGWTIYRTALPWSAQTGWDEFLAAYVK